MRNILSVILILTVLVFSGCAQGGQAQPTESASAEPSATEEVTTPAPSPLPSASPQKMLRFCGSDDGKSYAVEGYCFQEQYYLDCITSMELTIPYVYNGMTVTAIREKAFRGLHIFTSVVIPDSITSIGDWAFKGCSNLESVIISRNVKSIGAGAFTGCTSLKSVTIPEACTIINGSTFENCENLQTVFIPESITHIYDFSFANCKKLKEIHIPESVKYIGPNAFAGCRCDLNIAASSVPEDWDKSWQTGFEGKVNFGVK